MRLKNLKSVIARLLLRFHFQLFPILEVVIFLIIALVTMSIEKNSENLLNENFMLKDGAVGDCLPAQCELAGTQGSPVHCCWAQHWGLRSA